MTHSSTGNPFGAQRSAEPADGPHEPVRGRRMSLTLHLDDGSIKTVDLPAALDHPSQYSSAEFERLTRAYAEALGLLAPRNLNSEL